MLLSTFDARENDAFAKHLKGRWSPLYLAYCQSANPELAAAEAKRLSEQIEAEFDDVTSLHEHPLTGKKPTLGFLARLKKAQAGAPKLGEPAPELTARDLDGVERSLADYDGKVVVLHFWATWLPPSLGRISQLQALAKQYGSDRFRILGINLDHDRQAAIRFIKDREISWPSWSATDLRESIGLLASDFKSWPDLILIDHQGILRHRDPAAGDLEKAVRSLVEEAPDAEAAKR